MKAVILAAGKGTRMGSLTEATPKPMLPVRGKPILEHILDGIRDAGVDHVCVVTGWRAEVIESHFADGAQWNLAIEYVRQTTQDGTGKAPELAKDFVGDAPFFLTYGDILVRPSVYQGMRATFEQKACDGVISVIPGEDVAKGGVNIFDADFALERVVEKPSPDQLRELKEAGKITPEGPTWYNAGVYIFTPTLFEKTATLKKSPRNEYDLTDAINRLCQGGRTLAGYAIDGPWADVRDPETLKSLS